MLASCVAKELGVRLMLISYFQYKSWINIVCARNKQHVWIITVYVSRNPGLVGLFLGTGLIVCKLYKALASLDGRTTTRSKTLEGVRITSTGIIQP